MSKAPSYGGQAVMEGVVMRGPKYVALSVRKPDGDVYSMTKRLLTPAEKNPIARLPVLRGAFVFWDSFILGIDMLMKSAEISAPEEEIPSAAAVNFGVFLGLALAIGIFILLPAFVAPYLIRFLGVEGQLLTSLVEMALRLTVLFSYVGLVFRIPEIQRVLEYHGAEHKVIWAWERNHLALKETARKGNLDTAEIATHLASEAKSESRLHPRCGTSFLFIVVLCSWALFLFVTPKTIWVKLGLRLLLLPIAAGLSYEVMKGSVDKDTAIWKLLRMPGMALQKITTKEPDSGELEVAALSLVRLEEAERGVFR